MNLRCEWDFFNISTAFGQGENRRSLSGIRQNPLKSAISWGKVFLILLETVSLTDFPTSQIPFSYEISLGVRQDRRPYYDHQLEAHQSGALCEVYSPEHAKALWDRFEFIYTPKHSSWLNLAEIARSTSW